MANVTNWFDLATADFDRAVKFYSTILGAPVKVMAMGAGPAMGFFPMEGDGSGGSIIPPGMGPVPGPGGTRVFLNVEGKFDEVLGRVEAAGGKITVPKTLIDPKTGYFAFFQDTEGNIVGLHSSK